MDRRIRLPPGDTRPLECSAILADRRQRALLARLLDSGGPLTERDLAVELAARELGRAPPDVTEADLRQFRANLHHRYLPKLEAIGWIERTTGGVVATERLSFERTRLSLPAVDADDGPPWDALATLLGRPWRRDVVAIVADRDRPISLDRLADELAALERPARVPDGAERRSTLVVTLHHVDLPKLSAVGFVEYDADAKLVARGRLLPTDCHRGDDGDRADEP